MKVLTMFIMLLFTPPVFGAGFSIPFFNLMRPPTHTTYWKLQNMQRLVQRYAKKHHIDLDKWYRLIELESNWNRFAVSKKGAVGLCQIWPPTARSYGLTGTPERIRAVLQNPGVNIPLCAQLLSDLLDRYDGDWFNVAVAFNAGPGVVTYAQKISQGDDWVAKN